ncbi:MAG: N-acetylmuramoyl-L-alanine amidase [Bacteroidales bacterium]
MTHFSTTIHKVILITFLCLIGISLKGQSPLNTLKSPVEHFTNDSISYVKRDFTSYIQSYSKHLNPTIYRNSEEKKWLNYLNKKHPDVKSLIKIFKAASQKYNVPEELLMAIAYIESNWTQLGPSIDQRWGIMRLASNSYCHSLEDASALIQKSPQDLKDNAYYNIMGAAALLQQIHEKRKINTKDINNWFSVVAEYSGHINPLTKEIAAESYFKALKNGINGKTLWLENYHIPAQKSLQIENKLSLIKEQSIEKAKIQRNNQEDYQNWHKAIDQKIESPNFSKRKTSNIDVWVNHWFGVGTWAGAISWFQNPKSQVSSHFLVRNDGFLLQMVAVSQKAWHASVFNSRSIGIEHHATVDHPEYWESEAMLQKSTYIAREYCEDCQIPRIRRIETNQGGVFGHTDIPGVTKNCPGPLPWKKWMNYLGEDDINPIPDDKIIMDDFEINEGHFDTKLNYSGSTKGIDGNKCEKEKSQFYPKEGKGSLRVSLVDDNKSDEHWLVRILSGKGKPENNVTITKGGKLSLWIKTYASNMRVELWIDDKDGIETTLAKDINDDGMYHKYTWTLNDSIIPITGSGKFENQHLTLDALVIKAPNKTPAAVLYIDNIIFEKGPTPNLISDPDNQIHKNTNPPYPNPFNEFIFIPIHDKDIKISIYNLMGIRIMEKETSATKQLLKFETANLPKGSYILHVQSKYENKTYKILKQ